MRKIVLLLLAGAVVTTSYGCVAITPSGDKATSRPAQHDHRDAAGHYH